MEKEYELPDPKKNPVAALVLSYKTMKGIEFDDRNWDAIHWARCSKSARLLLGTCQSFEQSERCLTQLAQKFESSNLDWTFETVVKHSHEWMQKNGEKKHGSNARQRLFSEIAKRRAVERDQNVGKPTAAGEILASFGDLQILRPETGTDRRHADGSHG